MATTNGASYVVRVLPQAHEIEVSLQLEGLSGPVRLQTTTWVPGAYGFMKYGRDLFEVRAFDPRSGAELPVAREGWQGFVVEPPSRQLLVRYRAFAFDHAWGELAGLVDRDQAVLLATRYLFCPARPGKCSVRYELPGGWALHHPSGARKLGKRSFEYPSFAALLDTPVVLGRFERRTRTLAGTDFHFVFLDEALGLAERGDELVDDVMKIAAECGELFDGFPFEDYTFVLTFSPLSSWGLEHACATMIGLEPDTFLDPGAWMRSARVCAHELFHAWNVCRLKPAPLGDPDFDQGSFPEALWVSEGLTRYYEFLLLARTGLLGARDFFSNVVNYYRQLSSHPAYGRVSLLESSRATFLNHSRYPGSINASVDYYDAGMLVAFDLDAALRTSEPPTSLDEQFPRFYRERVGKGEGFTHAQAREFFAELLPELDEQIRREVECAGELQVVGWLQRLGFEVRDETVRYLGLVLDDETPAKIANLADDSPAAKTGIAPGDQILLVEGFSFTEKSLRWATDHRDRVTLTVRRGARQLEFTLAPRERLRIGGLFWRGDGAQLDRLRGWLGQPDLSLGEGEEIPLASFENFHGVQALI